ncbi:HEAT repeat domain-containing protein [Phormidium sp. CCY1219]|uniref:WD40 domain-containing protein n=1 Tax=Phormidium sp. CCY1219 TaxID=2886104 RepID=UPI002D1F8FBD|nr:HEAT repeat domain-containing protein [Phormidium sp. CCY1219]MEB3827403.1 hypothetical protein [Phormidium sp. CCY1219]
MEPEQLRKLAAQLDSDVPMMGRWLRRQAAIALAREKTPETVKILAKALIESEDETVQAIATETLRQLEDPEQIDTVCGVWAIARDPKLTHLLLERGWVACNPLPVRLLAALKTAQFETIIRSGAEIVKPLLAICRDRDPQIAHRARQCLFRLHNQEAIDALCKQWAMTRTPFLEQAILSGGYVARQPALVRVLSALKVGRMDVVTAAGAEVVEPLLIACRDIDRWLGIQALMALRKLDLAEAQEEVCRWTIDKDHPLAGEAAIAARYAPADPKQRAIFYVLTEQWREYQELEFHHSLLGAGYQEASQTLRSRIAQKARKAGRSEIVGAIVGGVRRHRLGDMTPREWETAIEILKEQQQWHDMWQLAQVAPAVWSVKLLREINPDSLLEWAPSREAKACEALKQLAHQCVGEVSALAGQMHCSHIIGDRKRQVTSFALGPAPINFTSDPPMVAIGTAEGSVQLWSTITGKLLKVLGVPSLRSAALAQGMVKHDGPVNCLAFSHPGVGSYGKTLLLASGSDDGTVRLWRTSTGQALKQLTGHTAPIHCLAISPTGEQLATGSADGTVRLWRLPTGTLQATLTGHQGWINCLGISPDGQLLVSGSSDGTVRLWLLPSGDLLQTLTGHEGPVECLSISPDGQLLATASWDKTVRLWWLPVGAPFKTLTGHTGSVGCMSFSPIGSQLATGSNDYTVRLWKIPDGEPLSVLEAHQGAVSCLGFNPTGDILASGSWDKTVRLWNANTGMALHQQGDHSDWIMGVNFSPNGQVLVTSSGDRTVRLWTSEISRLGRLPMSELSLRDLQLVHGLLRCDRTCTAERSWLEFLHALMRWHRRCLDRGIRSSLNTRQQEQMDLKFKPKSD